LHPGVIDTNLSRHLPPRDPDADTSHLKSIPQGTATQCYVATSPDLDRVTGYYFSDCNPAEPKATMQDDDMAAKLWAVSEELVADYL
ncbi:MAG: oxidoreductase, partial [Gammaproteobacteria bacterium]|nr:oxidoreductase [Gammaproteobacteria bacterium]